MRETKIRFIIIPIKKLLISNIEEKFIMNKYDILLFRFKRKVFL